MKKLLFICTSNITRSPTCEDILRGSDIYETRSAGTSFTAVVHVSQDLIDWADEVVVMCERTDKHATYLRENFVLGDKPIFDLDLPDFIYDKRGDPALVEDLKKRLSQYINI